MKIHNIEAIVSEIIEQKWRKLTMCMAKDQAEQRKKPLKFETFFNQNVIR